MEKEFKEMRKLLEEIASDVDSISKQKKSKSRKIKEKADIESLIKSEFSEVKRMIKGIDNQVIADSVSKMVINQMLSPLQDAIASAIRGSKKAVSVGSIAEDMKSKVERLSDRHIKVVRCISEANGEWINYNSLSGVCGISQSCLRGYISDLKRVYDIPLETSVKSGKRVVRLDPDTIKRLALGYQASKLRVA